MDIDHQVKRNFRLKVKGIEKNSAGETGLSSNS